MQQPSCYDLRFSPPVPECRMNKSARLVIIFLVLSLSAIPVWSQQEKVDLEMVTKIRYEGFRNSKIMQLASGLMDGIGPRLTGSPNMKRANEWTRDKLAEFGLSNAHLEPWGPFGSGWSYESCSLRLTSPDIAQLSALPRAWSASTS